MDLSWLDKIAPRALAKAVVELQQRAVDPDVGMIKAMEDEVEAAFRHLEEPPAFFLEGIKARFAAAALVRSMHKLSRIDDAKAARWVLRFPLEDHSLLLFQFLIEHLFLRYISEDDTSTLGDQSIQVLRQRTVGSVQSGPSNLFAKPILRFLNSPSFSFEDLASAVSLSSSSVSDVARLAPFDTNSASYSALCIKALLAGSAREAPQVLFGVQGASAGSERWRGVGTALGSMSLRVFSEIASAALRSVQKRELYWMESGRLNLKLRALINSRMKSPDTNPALWRFVAPELVSVYNMLLRGEVVEEFFDSGTDPARATFWKNYTAAMDRMPLTMGSNKQVFLMIFKNVGVIETKRAGMGAAYFSSLEDIDRVFMKPENQAQKHGFYKTMAPCPALASLSHVGAWQNDFLVYMQRTYGIIPNGKI